MKDSSTLAVGDRVRYQPGRGTYGYEDVVEADGRIPAEVQGFTTTRIRVRFLFGRLKNRCRAVDRDSLMREA